jgi:magnesium chelatase family protein
LFLDELAEFSRPALEALRQPLEAARVEVTRGQRSIGFPAAVMLVGACNACPCGSPRSHCECAPVDRARYRRRLSGPLLDRIDMICQLDAGSSLPLVADDGDGTEGSAAVRARVVSARERQRRRLSGSGALCNAAMDAPLTRRHVRLDARLRARLVERQMGGLSARGHDRVLRLARTIADLEGSDRVAEEHVDEALGYRLSGTWRAAA